MTLILLVLLALPIAANAQSEVLWELNPENYLDITDLGFRFHYPVGWLWGSGSNGIVIAATQADLDAHLDDDDDTLAEGEVISILGIPLEGLADLGENPKMDEFADFAVEVGQITETERVEVPVMSRRSISVIGENSVGRAGIGTIWTQNGYLVLTSLGAPDAAAINELAYTWGVTLSVIEPLNVENLGKGALASDVSQFSMNYPESWTADARQPEAVVYEFEEDIGQEFAEVDGITMSFLDSPLADLGAAEDATVDDLATAMGGSFGLDETAVHEEFVFLGQPAVVSSGEVDDGSGGKRGLILTTAIVDG